MSQAVAAHASPPSGGLSTISLAQYVAQHNLPVMVARAIEAAALARADCPVAAVYSQLQSSTSPLILHMVGRQILDSRGIPAVECEVVTYKGAFRASCPAGDFGTRPYETLELRDAGDDFHGQGVLRAVYNINHIIAPALEGRDPTQQAELDELMTGTLDGTANLSHLGANAIMAASAAVCKAGAAEAGLPLYRHVGALAGNARMVLPVPQFNALSGGLHSGAANGLPVQEFLLFPSGAASFAEAMRMGTETYHHLKRIIGERYGQKYLNVGHDGAFSPPLHYVEDALKLIVEAIAAAGHIGKVKICLDAAASEFFVEENVYDMGYKMALNDGSGQLLGEQLGAEYERLCTLYPVVSIEDPFEADDFINTKEFAARALCQVAGDALLLTDPNRVRAALAGRVCNALVLKPTQRATVTAAAAAVASAKNGGWGVVACHRSGETEDDFLADLAVGLACGQIKAGAPCRSERLAKYNQLLRIEEELGADAVYAGGLLMRAVAGCIASEEQALQIQQPRTGRSVLSSLIDPIDQA